METTKVLTKEEIQAALEERHSPEKQKKLHRKSVRYVKHRLPSSKSRAEKKHGLLNML